MPYLFDFGTTRREAIMLKLTNISKYYHSKNSVTPGLKNITAEFNRGEFVAITGESGSGKSTLLNVISGLTSYEDGELYVENSPTSHFDDDDWEEYRRNYIGFVFQNYNLIDSYTALENVISSLLIQSVPYDLAKTRALELLDKVGIKDRADHRASELSSGQKQRLSIARALAKNTNIIVADEPTGNLDVENGRQIMSLFKELSKDHLVIVVTHNYSEASEFATRRINLHNGEISADEKLDNSSVIDNVRHNAPKSSTVQDNSAADIVKNPGKLKSPAGLFAHMNLKAQPRKLIFVCSFLFFIFAASFIFMGTFLSNLDDTATKNYSNKAFYNSSDNRLIIRHPDGAYITDEDIAKLYSLKHVCEVDKYDLINDINYFCVPDTDYAVRYIAYGDGDTIVTNIDVTLLNYTKFMRSSTCLSENDLAYGRLPESSNEIVIYSLDESLIGTNIPYYISNERIWATGSCISMDMTICGLLKEPSSNTYFSEILCKALCANAYGVRANLYASPYYKGSTAILYPDASFGGGDCDIFVSSDAYGKYYDRTSDPFIIYATEDINNENAKSFLSDDLILNAAFHDSSDSMVIVSDSVIEKYYAAFPSTQASLYIEDYAYADDVIKAASALGYEVLSPFRAGSLTYNSDKVKMRIISLGISVAAFVILFFLDIIILQALLKFKKNDFIVLKSLGMKSTLVHKINYHEMLCCCTISAVLVISLIAILNYNGVAFIKQVFKYFRIQHFLLLIIFNLLAAFISTARFNHFLDKSLIFGKQH